MLCENMFLVKKKKNREKPIKIVFLVSIRASSLPFTAVEAVAHSTKFGKKKNKCA